MADKKNNPAPAKAAGKPVAASGKAAKGAVKDEPSKSLSARVEQAVQFLREVKTELKKVTWPSRKQTMSSTGVVVGLVIVISLFLGLVDYVLTHVVRFLIS
ncbi:MAG: preprotein translocase subunit SecE [Pseudomonadota bacterium]